MVWKSRSTATDRVKALSNKAGLPAAVPPEWPLRIELVDAGGAPSEYGQLIRHCLGARLVIWEGGGPALTLLCLLRALWPLFRFRLVSVDLILRAPTTLKGKFLAAVRRVLFTRVDRFIFYFRNLEGYRRVYGIRPERCIFVPFKVNDPEGIRARTVSPPAEEFVLCTGRSRRDFKTFVEAIRLSGCPGLLHQEDASFLAGHGTTAWSGPIPENLQVVVDDRRGAFLDYIARARIVVIPRFRGDIAPAGVATYLAAMALNKCCVLSEGPGHDDNLTGGEAVIVPPEDADALACQLRLLWDDSSLRNQIAARGQAYAASLGDEQRLMSDILAASVPAALTKKPLREPLTPAPAPLTG